MEIAPEKNPVTGTATRPGGIDAHQHFWKFDPVRDSWITDEMSAIQWDFLPRDLEPLLAANNLEGCIAVQSDQSEDHNGFLLELASKHDSIKGVVGWVDLQADHIHEALQYYKQFPIVKGFRHVLQGETDRALMLKPNFMRGIEALRHFDYTYDILVFPDQLPYVRQFVSAFPDHKFVIDHIAKPGIREGSIVDWQHDMVAIAEYENVYCKISGMVTEAHWKEWKAPDFRPYINVVAEAFGPNRIMFGSDWPVCLVAASYTETISIVQDYFSTFTRDEQEAFFGGNARRFYSL